MLPLISYGVRVTTEECSVAVLIMSCQCIVGVIIQVVKSNYTGNQTDHYIVNLFQAVSDYLSASINIYNYSTVHNI